MSYRPVVAATSATGVARSVMLLAILVAASFLIRLYGLWDDPVWFDEASTLEIAGLPISDLLGEMARLESSPPGYYLLAKAWIYVFGTDIIWLRLLSAMAGALAVIPVWLFARNAFGERTAWLAALLLALAASQVRMSQDARVYTVLFLVFCCSLVVALRLTGIRSIDRSALVAMLVLGLLQAVLAWLHATAPVLILCLFVFLLAASAVGPPGFWRGMAIGVGSGVVTVVVASLPFSYAILHVIKPEFSDRWIAVSGVLESLRLYGRTLVAPFLYELSPVAALLQAVLLGLAVITGLRRQDKAVIGLATAALAVSGMVVPAISNVVPFLLDRTVLFLLVPLLLLVAKGATSLPTPTKYAASLCLLVLQGVGVINYYRVEIRKEQWPVAAALITAQGGRSQPIMVTEGAFAGRALAIALGERGRDLRIIVVPPASDMERFVARRGGRDLVENPADLCAAVAEAPSVWLVTRSLPPTIANDDGFTAKPRVTAVLQAAGSMILMRENFGGIEVERWSAPRCR